MTAEKKGQEQGDQGKETVDPHQRGSGGTEQEWARQGAKTGCLTGRKGSGNNWRKRIDWNDYYEREDDESL